MSINRSVFYGENVFYSQAGNRVSPIYCISCRVEGKPGLITVGRILLNYILILCDISSPNCSHMSFVVLQEKHILLYNDLLSFRLFWGHEVWTGMTNVRFYFRILQWTTSFTQLWNAYCRLYHKSCSEGYTTVFPSLRRASYL